MEPSTVFIVEDDRGIAALLAHVLRSAGYQVINANSPAEAAGVGQGYEHPIALLLCDVILQDRAGPDIARSVADLHPEMKTIFMSGYPFDILVDRGLLTPEMLESGKMFYLQKPFRPAELVQVINRIVDTESAAAISELAPTGVGYASAAS